MTEYEHWAGLSTDLVIEQELMRSIKTNGGLTRGTGMSENQRDIWVLSRPLCGQVANSMQNLTGVHQKTSEQNKDLSNARQEKDWNDMKKIKNYINDRNPFEMDENLVSISTGIHENSSVNVDEAKSKGLDIIKDMDGKSTQIYTFRRKHQVVTMASKQTVNIDREQVQIDPNLLFQRLASCAYQSPDTLENALEYELCSYPPSLFDSTFFMREAQKSQLTECILNLTKESNLTVTENVQNVLDRGSLLHKIPWGQKYVCVSEQ